MESMDALLGQLTAIKWLLVVVAACAVAIALLFVFIAVNMYDVTRENRRDNQARAKVAELEELLASGKSQSAKFTALEWVAAEPLRADAHWALAKAHHQLGELSEAKQVLKGLLRVAPDEHYRVDAWLEMLETEFSERRPKPVG